MPGRTYDRRPYRTVMAVVASVALVAGCTAPAVRSGPAPTSVTALPPSKQMDVTAAAGTSSPVDAAEHWLAAYRGVSWSDGNPTAWIARVRPYVTATLDAQDEQYADAGGGADWQAFVAQQCTTIVTDLGAVIPSESPGTPTAVNVEVTGTVHTACDAGRPATRTATASATVVVISMLDGSWRVNQRLY